MNNAYRFMDGYVGLSDWDWVNWDDCQKVEQFTWIHPMQNEWLWGGFNSVGGFFSIGGFSPQVQRVLF